MVEVVAQLVLERHRFKGHVGVIRYRSCEKDARCGGRNFIEGGCGFTDLLPTKLTGGARGNRGETHFWWVVLSGVGMLVLGRLRWLRWWWGGSLRIGSGRNDNLIQERRQTMHQRGRWHRTVGGWLVDSKGGFVLGHESFQFFCLGAGFVHRGQQLLLLLVVVRVVVVGLALHYGDGGRNNSGFRGGGRFESVRTDVLNVLAKGTGVVGQHGDAPKQVLTGVGCREGFFLCTFFTAFSLPGGVWNFVLALTEIITLILKCP